MKYIAYADGVEIPRSQLNPEFIFIDGKWRHITLKFVNEDMKEDDNER